MKPILILIACIITLSSCKNDTEQETESIQEVINHSVILTSAQFQNAHIQTGKLMQKNISTLLNLNGKIDVPPQNMISVSNPLGGFLKTTKLLPGMPIKKGEILATMEDEKYIQLQQEYLIAKSRLTYQEAEFQRQKELNQNKASSDKILQQSIMDFQAQKITVNALSEKLRLININPETLSESNLSRSINIYSSIDGFVSKVNVNIGKYVNPSDVLFELINPDDIHLNLTAYEKDVEKLAIGQKVQAYSNNQPNRKYPCKIILVSQNLSSDRSAEIHCHFEVYDKILLPGMYMNAEIEITSNNAACINDDAIVHFEGKDYLFISKETYKYEMIEVKIGHSDGHFTEILPNNLIDLSNSMIVKKGAYTLLMQLKNKIDE